MGLIDKLKEIFRLRSKESGAAEPELKFETPSFRTEHNVYCQNCGRDITIEGGDISSNRRLYCHGYKEDGSRCLDREMTEMIEGMLPHGPIFFNYHDADEVQKAIRKKKLTKYSPLESI